MKLFSAALAALALLVAPTNGSLMLRMTAEEQNSVQQQQLSNLEQQNMLTLQQVINLDQQNMLQLKQLDKPQNPVQRQLSTFEQQNTVQQQQQKKTEQQNPVRQQPQSTPTSSSGCYLTGTYKKGTDISSCVSITVDTLSVPAGVTLDLSRAMKGAIIEFKGITTFGVQKWPGPLVSIRGDELTVKGRGILDGQGSWYWKQGTAITRPVFVRLQSVTRSTVSGLTIKNMPYHTFSLVNCYDMTITGLMIDARAGNGIAKNTDAFGLTMNDYVTITNNTIYNQDDCLAMQSSTNTVFSNNYCFGSHGISIGSLGGDSVDLSTTVRGLVVEGNTVVDSDNGLRIKAIIGLKGLVSNVSFVNNKLKNVRNAIVIHSDYSKDTGRYTGVPTSQVQIVDVTVSGLTGSASNLYDIKTNPKVVADCTFSGIQVTTSVKRTLTTSL